MGREQIKEAVRSWITENTHATEDGVFAFFARGFWFLSGYRPEITLKEAHEILDEVYEEGVKTA